MSTIHDLTPLIKTNTIQDRNIASNIINTSTSTNNIVVKDREPSMPREIIKDTNISVESQIELLANEVIQTINEIKHMNDSLITLKAGHLVLEINERIFGLIPLSKIYDRLNSDDKKRFEDEMIIIRNELLELKNLPGNAYNRTLNNLSSFNNSINNRLPTANMVVKDLTPLSTSNINSRVKQEEIITIVDAHNLKMNFIKESYTHLLSRYQSIIDSSAAAAAAPAAAAAAAPAAAAPGAPAAAAAPAETSRIRRALSTLGTLFERFREYIPDLEAGREAALNLNKYYSNQIGGLPETREQELQRQLAEIQGQLAILQSARAHGPINNTHIPRKYADLCALLRSTESK
jgi:hypothetical protein